MLLFRTLWRAHLWLIKDNRQVCPCLTGRVMAVKTGSWPRYLGIIKLLTVRETSIHPLTHVCNAFNWHFLSTHKIQSTEGGSCQHPRSSPDGFRELYHPHQHQLAGDKSKIKNVPMAKRVRQRCYFSQNWNILRAFYYPLVTLDSLLPVEAVLTCLSLCLLCFIFMIAQPCHVTEGRDSLRASIYWSFIGYYPK